MRRFLRRVPGCSRFVAVCPACGMSVYRDDAHQTLHGAVYHRECLVERTRARRMERK